MHLPALVLLRPNTIALARLLVLALSWTRQLTQVGSFTFVHYQFSSSCLDVLLLDMSCHFKMIKKNPPVTEIFSKGKK